MPMVTEITVGCPTGRHAASPPGTTTADLAAAIGRRLAAASVAAEVDGDARRPRPSRLPTAPGSGSSRLRRDEGRDVLRHSTAHVLAQAVLAALARRALRDRPGDRRRLLLRLRAPRRRPLQRGRPGAHRGRDAGDRRRGPALRPRGAHDRRGPRALRRPALQARDHRGRVAESVAELDDELAAEVGGDPAPSARTATATAFVDLCRGSACAFDRTGSATSS